MNPILELRWKISMLEIALADADVMAGGEKDCRAKRLLEDLRTELATLERFHAEALADGERQARRDREKAK